MVEVRFNRSVWNDALEIYLIERREDGRIAVGLPAKLEFKMLTESDMGSIQEPTFKLNGFWGKAFLQAFADALDKDGIKTDKDAKIEGTLTATRYHLEDLRSLLKLTDALSKKEQKK